MRQAARVVLSIATGIVVALVLVVAVELFSAVVHPLPPDFGGTEEEMCAHVERYPQWVLAAATVLWGGTTFLSCAVAKRIGNRWSGLTVGLLLLAAVLFNVAKLPYPMWFKVITPALQGLIIVLNFRSPSPRHR
jgi:hypothetical protein